MKIKSSERCRNSKREKFFPPSPKGLGYGSLLLTAYCLLLTGSQIFGEFGISSIIIDSPTAYTIPRGVFEASLNFSTTTPNDPYSFDADLFFTYGLPIRGEITLAILTTGIVTLGIKWNWIKEEQTRPAISLGVYNIATEKYFCSVGTGREKIWADDSTYGDMRNTEQFSYFVVMTKDFGPWGKYNLAIGRGSFVGYGPRSHLFNTDLFSTKHHNDAIGIIWGGEIELTKHWWACMDFDGRDFNVAVKFKRDFYQIGIAAGKLEHRLGGAGILYPRFCMGLTVNSKIRKLIPEPPPKVGAIAGKISDAKTGKPLKAIISFPGTNIPPITTDINGKYTVTMLPATYRIRAVAGNYYWIEKKIFVSKGMTTICNFRLKSK